MAHSSSRSQFSWPHSSRDSYIDPSSLLNNINHFIKIFSNTNSWAPCSTLTRRPLLSPPPPPTKCLDFLKQITAPATGSPVCPPLLMLVVPTTTRITHRSLPSRCSSMWALPLFRLSKYPTCHALKISSKRHTLRGDEEY